MKKQLSLLFISILLAFVACGPSQENIVSQEKAKQDSIAIAAQNPLDFNTFLQTFIKSINDNNNQDSYINKNIGVYVYSNPGAFCMALKSEKMEIMDAVKEISINNIFNREPKGSFCEGYPGEKDGFYYFETSKDILPSYYDVDSDLTKTVVLPRNLNYEKFMKVNIIIGESFSADLYFTCIDSRWYLIGQNFCDCSA